MGILTTFFPKWEVVNMTELGPTKFEATVRRSDGLERTVRGMGEYLWNWDNGDPISGRLMRRLNGALRRLQFAKERPDT